MTYHNLRHDKSGRWTRKTRWDLVFLAVGAAIIFICYLVHTHNVGNVASAATIDNSSQGIAEVEQSDLQDVLPDCKKVNSGSETFLECSSVENLAKWNAFLESELAKVKTRRATVTMYTSRPQETDESPCIAASGKDICKLHNQGVNVCASNDYKLGTRLQIEGLGQCVVLDHMNRRYTGTGRVDWYNGMDVKGAFAHGHPTLNITIIE